MPTSFASTSTTPPATCRTIVRTEGVCVLSSGQRDSAQRVVGGVEVDEALALEVVAEVAHGADAVGTAGAELDVERAGGLERGDQGRADGDGVVAQAGGLDGGDEVREPVARLA